MSLDKELDFVKGLAREAGEELLQLAQQKLKIMYKGATQEVVTSADKALDALIIRELTKHYPDDGILTEESSDTAVRQTKRRVWIIDPIDGTNEFVEYLETPEKHPYFGIHIGLAIDHHAALGVVEMPARQRTYYAARNYGAYVIDNANERGRNAPMQVNNNDTLEYAQFAITSNPLREMTAAFIKKSNLQNVTYIPSIGVALCSIAEGSREGYVSIDARGKEWDTCAPAIILEEAGGKITDRYGNPISYNKRDVLHRDGIIATNSRLHALLTDASKKMGL